ncbi:MAG: TMEM165/GDT1 family protein [Clostridiaceae bacterium]|nr:TMEM165/GDT1 family protein [Clostridiaceae bacterium]
MQEILKAFMLIFIAEMGDKTQILAMAFATKFPVKKVLLGIFLGAFLNHGMAVALGSYISGYIPVNVVQITAGAAFIGFSIWTLKSEDSEDEDEGQKFKSGPVLTVALAFFIGELGDKTQLTAITLAADTAYPLYVLCGTVLGMVVTGGIGIIIGKKLGDKMPEFAVKILAASVFMFFGISKLYRSIPRQYITLQSVSIFSVIILILILTTLMPVIERRKQGKISLFKTKSRELYNYYKQAEENINKICLGVQTCGECQGNSCIVGYTKTLIKRGLEEDEFLELGAFVPKEVALSKKYDKERVSEALNITLALLKKDPSKNEYQNIHEIRKQLETILFNKSIDHMDSWEEYQKHLNDIDKAHIVKIY